VTMEELEAIVAGGEQTQVEFKGSTGQRSEAARTVCGMLNGTGGFVLFGVNDRGQVVGQEMGTHTLEQVVAELRRVEPRIPLEPETVSVADGRAAIAVRVPGATGRTYTYDGRPYVRQGPTTAVMSQDEYRRRLLEEMHPSNRWELLRADGVGLDDLDAKEIVRTVDEAMRRGRMLDPATREPADLLRGLGLFRDGELVNAAVALFARPDRLLPSYPQCVIRLAKFRGATMAEFEDNRQYHGNVFELLATAQTFLRHHLPIASRIDPDQFERIDEPAFPPEALREALINALCHRDYQHGGGSVSVAIFDDRLEIASTGGLHFGLTPEDLQRPHASQPWNPLIASVLHRRGFIEQWGRGTLRIAELTESAGLARPEFEERTGDLVVRFRPTRYVAPRRVEHDLTPLQHEVLGIVGESTSISLAEIRSRLSTPVPERTLQHALRALRDFTLVELSGRGPGARWRLAGR